MPTTENKRAFFARLEPRLATSELARVRGAYYLAKYGHRAQVRKEKDDEGHPLRYFEHVRRAALILMDEAGVYAPDLVITALLHDALEDTDDIDALVVEQFFGSEVARRVRLLTKRPKRGYVQRLWSADPETVLVKMCDRLDNLRSLEGCGEAFIAKQILETQRDYLPLFGEKLGVGGFHSFVRQFVEELNKLERGVQVSRRIPTFDELRQEREVDAWRDAFQQGVERGRCEGMAERWSTKWPEEPGDYLFYGGFKGHTPMMDVCRVAPSSTGKLTYATPGFFLYPEEHEGAFMPLDVKPPDLDKLRREGL